MTRTEIPVEVATEAYLRLKSYARAAAELGVCRDTLRLVLREAGIESIGRQQGVRRWTAEQTEYLRQNYGTLANVEIAAHLGLTARGVQSKAAALGLTRPAQRRWTHEEMEYLTANFGRQAASDIAIRLDRPAGAVRVKAQRMGLQPRRNVWTRREITYLQRQYGSVPATEIATHLRRSKNEVRKKARLLGLTRPANRRWIDMRPEDAEKLFREFQRSKVSVGNFCNLRGFSKVLFARTMRHHFGESYEEWVEKQWPKRTWYVRGRNFEYSARKYLEKNGYPHVVRSYRSRGVADLTAVGPGGTLLVQCKRGGYLRPAEHNELWELAEKCRAIPILAGLPDGRNKRFWVLTGPHTRRGYRPIEEISFPWSPTADSAVAQAV